MTNAYLYPQNAVSYPSTIEIDRLSLLLDQSEERQHFLRQTIIPMSQAIGSKTDDYPFPEWGIERASMKGYRYALRFHAPAGGGARTTDHILVGAEPRSGMGGYVRMKWTPARFTAVQHRALFEVLSATLFPDGGSDTGAFLNGAKATECHIAATFHGIRIGSFTFDHSRAKHRRVFAAHGEITGLYHGLSAGKAQVCVYDKNHQRRAEGIPVEGDLLRIEARLRPHCALHQVAAMANPFSRLVVSDVMGAKLGLPVPHRSALHRLACYAGMEVALADLPAETRENARKAIQSVPVPWWDPAQVWAEVPKLLSSIINPTP